MNESTIHPVKPAKWGKALLCAFLSAVLAIGLVPALPQTAHAEELTEGVQEEVEGVEGGLTSDSANGLLFPLGTAYPLLDGKMPTLLRGAGETITSLSVADEPAAVAENDVRTLYVGDDVKNGPEYGTHEYWLEKDPNHNHTSLITSNGRTLSEGTYYLSGSNVVTNPYGNNNDNALTIAAGNKVTIVMETGSSLSCTGRPGSGTRAGGAGIYLPSNSTLTFVGKGSVTARGGIGGQATDGAAGESNVVAYTSGSSKGGKGGNGGGAPGAGIGGKGGNGGGGASGGELNRALNIGNGGGPGAPYSGSSGGYGTSAGNVFAKGSVAISASAGNWYVTSGGAGLGGPSSSTWDSSNPSAHSTHSFAGGGGGGGGGAAGSSAGIGGAGNGGGGGGGGGSGSQRYDSSGQDRKWGLGGGGGGGGGGGLGLYYGGRGGAAGKNGRDQLPSKCGESGTTADNYYGRAGGAGFIEVYNENMFSGSGSAGGDAPRWGGSAGKVYATTLSGASAGSNDYANGASSACNQVFPISECTIETVSSPTATDGKSWAFTGSAIAPEIKVTHVPSGRVLKKGSEYTVNYSSNINGGQARMVVSGTALTTSASRGSLVDSSMTAPVSLSFNYDIKYDTSDAKIVYKNPLPSTESWYTYTGSSITPVELKTNKDVSIPTAAYSVGYSNNAAPGMNTAKADISLLGDYWITTPGPSSFQGLFSIITAPTITTDNATSFKDMVAGAYYELQLDSKMQPETTEVPITWSVTSGTLPAGVTLDSKTGLISGKPETTADKTVTIRATNAAGYSEKTFTWEMGDLSGTLYTVDSGGNKTPVKNGKVEAYALGGDVPITTAEADAMGRYVLKNLAAGHSAVDLVFSAQDASEYRPMDPAREKNVVLGSASSAKVFDKQYEQAVHVTLNAGGSGWFDGDVKTKIVRGWADEPLRLAPPETVDEGAHFTGYFDQENGGTKYNGTCPAADKTFYAQYDNRVYTVTYDMQGAEPQIDDLPVAFDSANLLPDPAPTRAGYSFDGWYVKGDADQKILTQTDLYSDLVGNVTTETKLVLVAKWTLRTDIPVKLMANGSDLYEAYFEVEGQKVNEVSYKGSFGDPQDYPPPIRDGFSFIGWSEKQAYDPVTDPKPIMSLVVPGFDTVYYAQWQAKDIGVDFDAMDGSFKTGEDGKRAGKPGVEYGIPEKPERDGYTFKGWFTRPLSGDLVFSDTDTKGAFPTASTVYYAQWEANNVTLRLEAAGAAPDVQELKGTSGQTVSYALPQKAGYAFTGWKLPDGTTSMFISYPMHDATYQAEFAAGKIAVAFNPMGGAFKAGEGGIRQGDVGATYDTPENPERAGYDFAGWYTTTEYAVEAPTDKKFPLASATYYAKWEASQIKVTLNASGAEPGTQELTGPYNTLIPSTPGYKAPEKTNETFMGWKLQGAQDATATMFPVYPVSNGAVFEAVFKTGISAVSFNTNGGTFTDKNESGLRTGAKGSSLTLPADPVRSGYQFEGWYDKSDSKITAPAVFPDATNTEYKAKWKILESTVYLKAGEGANPPLQQLSGAFESPVDYQTPARTGFTFMGWKLEGSLDSSAVKSLKFPATNTSYAAVWAENSVVVTYDAQGGQLKSGYQTLTPSGIPHAEYDIPQVERVGYKFMGWWTLPVGGVSVHDVADAKATFPAESVTHYAHWTPLSITMQLKGNGGSPDLQEAQGDYGTVIRYSTMPTRGNHAFIGWSATDNASEGNMFPVYPAENSTLFAIWREGAASVAYDPQGGKFAEKENGVRTGKSGDTYTPPVDPTRTGYDFSGWFTQPEGQGAEYKESKYPDVPNTIVYAKWEPKRIQATLNLNYQGSSEPTVFPDLVFGQAIKYDMPARPGFAFTGWSTTSDNASNDATMFPAAPEANVELFAQWKANKVTVLFDALNGVFPSGETGVRTGDAGALLTSPVSPELPGFRFVGWFEDSAGTKPAALTNYPKANATYFAKWEVESYTVTLKPNGADSGNDVVETGAYNTPVPYSAPERAGYTFVGWSTTSDNSSNDATMSPRFPSANVSLYATWTPRTVKVVYHAAGGTIDGEKEKPYSGNPGDSYEPPTAENTVRAGYELIGWADTPNGGNAPATPATIPVKDTVYYAQWKAADITISFDPKGGKIDGSGAVKTMTGAFGSLVDPVPTPVRNGYSFGGWKESAASDDSATRYLLFPATNTTYVAVWHDADKVSVTYNAMGGIISGSSDHAKTFTQAIGSEYTSPSVDAREGYTFKGWGKTPTDAVGDHNGDVPRSIPATAVSYYALWEPVGYSVMLDYANGLPAKEAKGTLGARIPYDLPDRPGYTFKGWKLSGGSDAPDMLPTFSASNNAKTLVAQWDAVTLTVAFNAMQGTGDASFSGNVGQTYKVPADAARMGWRFIGWWSEPDAKGSKLDAAAGVDVAFAQGGTAVWYAAWEQVEVEVTLDPAGGIIDGSHVPVKRTGFYDEMVPNALPNQAGYTFQGWKTASGEANKALRFPGENAEYTAEWTADSSTITFDATSGAFDAPETGVRNGVTDGEFVAGTDMPNDPKRMGYDFGGWFIDKACTNPAVMPAKYPAGGVTYYAKWNIKHPTVQLSAPGSDNELQTAAGDWGTPVYYNIPTKQGHVFKGWKKLRSNDVPSLQLAFPESDTNYEAVFVKGSVTAYFDANGGAFKPNEPDSRTGEPDDSYTAPTDTDVAKTGYNFDGWYTKPVGGDKIGSDPKFGASNVTWFAHWTPQTIQVTLDMNDGSSSSVTKEGAFGTSIAYGMPTRSGFTFMGWSKTPSNTDHDATMFPMYALDLSNEKLYAIWDAAAVQVSFFALGGTPDSAQRVSAGESYTVPANPVRAGYLFDAWYSAPADPATKLDRGSGQQVTVNKAGNITWYARWNKRADISVVLDAGVGGSFSGGSQTATIGSGTFGDPVSYDTPTKAGYTFKGWKLRTTPPTPDRDASTSLTFPAENATYDAVWASNNVELTFNANEGAFDDGETEKKIQGAADEHYSMADAPQRTGYAFEGWFSLPVGGTNVTTQAKYPARSATYYAHWKQLDVTVELKAGEGEFGPDTGEKEKEVSGKFGDVIEYAIPVYAGHGFVGWKIQGTDDATAVPFPTFPDEKTTYEAVYQANTQSALFRTQGGSFKASNEKGLRSGPVGTSYSEPELASRAGYMFEGWYSEPSGGTELTEYKIPQASTIYYAQWTAQDVGVTLDGNGGTFVGDVNPGGNTATVHGTVNTPIDYTNAMPVRPGYGFLGWSDNPSAASGDLFPKFPTANGETLYAIWEAGSVTTHFRTMGGTSSDVLAITGDPETSYTVPLTVRTGYVFAGWFADPANQSTPLGKNPGEVAKLGASDATWYAQWNEQSITVTLEPAGGSIVGSSTKTGKQGEVINYDAPVKPGYTFMGWQLAPENRTIGAFSLSADAITKHPVFNAAFSSSTVPDAPAYTLVAQYEANAVTVTYDSDDVASRTEKTGTYGTSYDLPSNPAREGYAFEGWYSEPHGRGSQHAKPDALGKYAFPASDTTWYAKWSPMQVKVAFQANGGSITQDDETGTVGDPVPYDVPEKTGAVFMGWQMDGGGEALRSITFPEKTPNPTPTDPVATFTAVWQDAAVVKTIYYAEGGSVEGDQPLDGVPGTTFAAPSAQREGYIFKGWFRTPNPTDLSQPHHNAGDSVTRAADSQTPYFAGWEAEKYQVQLNPNGGTMKGKTEAVTKEGTIGQTIAYDIPERGGYAFMGWSDNSAATSGNMTPTFSASTKNKTLFAVWSANAASVAFFADGGGDTFITGTMGAEWTVPTDPSRAGHAFQGWYLDEGCTQPASLTAGNSFKFSQSNKAYWAKWTLTGQSVKVELMMNDGTETVYDAPVGPAGNVVSYTPPMRSGYSFMGWGDTSDASTGAYSLTFPSSDVKRYALWEANSVKVAFAGQGGAIKGETEFSGTVGNAYTLPTDPERAGYTFIGWSEKPVAKVPADIVSPDGKFPAVSKTYFAQWQLKDVRVTLDPNGGTMNGDSSAVVVHGTYRDSVVYTTPVYSKHVFKGWRPEGEQDDAARMYIQFGKDDSKYAAVWQRADKLSAVYYAMGGVLKGNAEYDDSTSDSYRAPDVVAPAGMTFKGWRTSPDISTIDHQAGVSKTFIGQRMPKVAYYPLYVPATGISVELDPAGGTINGSPNKLMIGGLTAGSAVVYPMPEREDMEFVGWVSAANDDARPTQDLIAPNESASYRAVWVAGDAYTKHVRYDAGSGALAAGGQETFEGLKGESYTAPGAVAPAGMVFKGWASSRSAAQADHQATDTKQFGSAVQVIWYALYAPLASVTVKLDPAGGMMDGSPDVKALYNQTAGSKVSYTEPVKDNMVFVGWVPADDENALPTQDLKVPNADATFVALWKKGTEDTTKAVVYNANGGEVDGQSVLLGKTGSPYTVPGVKARAGYVFDGWAEVAGGPIVQHAGDLASFGIAPQTSYYAAWSPRSDVSVTLDLNGGNVSGKTDPVKMQGLVYGKALGYVPPVREGYVFLGWAIDRQAQVGEVSLKVPAEDALYFAIWLKSGETPTASSAFYDGMGGFVQGDATFTGAVGGTYTAPSMQARPGWTFMGFSDTPGGAVTHNAGDKRTLPQTPATYYALWKQAADSVLNLVANGGTLTGPSRMDGLYANSMVTPSIPVRDGFVFLGWAQSASAATGSSSVVVVEGETTFYAIWGEKPADPDTRLVVFDGHGGQANQALFTGKQGDSLTVPGAQRAGFNFLGWSSVPDGSIVCNEGEEIAFGAQSPTVYYAVWDKQTASVSLTLKLAGGTINGSGNDVVLNNNVPGNIVVPDTPQLSGFVFGGWLGEAGSSASSAIVVPESSAIYTAQWIKIPEPADTRMVMYFGMGGSVQGQSVLVGVEDTTYTAPSVSERAGYVFDGWSATEDASVVDHQAGEVRAFGTEQQTSYYAKWSRKLATLNLDADGGLPALQTLEGGVGVAVSYATPSKDGYVFTGWSTTKGASAGTMSPLFATETDGGTMYAVWSKKDAPIPPTPPAPGPSGGGSGGDYPVYVYPLGTNNGSSGVQGGPGATLGQGSNSSATSSATADETAWSVALKMDGGTVTSAMKKGKLTYAFASDDGFEIDSVYIDGRAVELKNGSYTFDAAGDHTVAVAFKQVAGYAATAMDVMNKVVLFLPGLIIGLIVGSAVVLVCTRRKKEEEEQA